MKDEEFDLITLIVNGINCISEFSEKECKLALDLLNRNILEVSDNEDYILTNQGKLLYKDEMI